MPSIQDRDKIIKECWVNARFRHPDAHPGGEHYSVQVMGVIDDPRYRLNNKEQPFVDVVAYWPAIKKWTITHQSRCSQEADDYPVTVTHWQPIMPLPW